jgi:hypothetical protein
MLKNRSALKNLLLESRTALKNSTWDVEESRSVLKYFLFESKPDRSI